MAAEFRSLLYTDPRLYDLVFPDAVDTFAAHARPGTLLALDALNARSYLEGDGFVAHIASRVETPEFTASSESHHTLDRETRILTRRRTWHIRGRSDVEDYARYRLLEPEELTRLIEAGGFQMRDLFDNREFRSTELRGRPVTSADPGGMAGRKLYAFALAS